MKPNESNAWEWVWSLGPFTYLILLAAMLLDLMFAFCRDLDVAIAMFCGAPE